MKFVDVLLSTIQKSTMSSLKVNQCILLRLATLTLSDELYLKVSQVILRRLGTLVLGGQRLEAAMVALHKVGGGAVVNLDHPNK
jgi:hypothetical protein